MAKVTTGRHYWGPWHEGNGLSIRIATDGRDTYPHNFKCKVEIMIGSTVYTRTGRGQFIGNFSPIWIRLNNREYQITELLRDGFAV